MSGLQDSSRYLCLALLSRDNASAIYAAQCPDRDVQLEFVPVAILLSVFAQWIGSNCAQDGDSVP